MWKLNPSSPRSRYASEMDKTFYQRYLCAKTRCINKNRKQYRDYWWRGIKFLRENFEDFYNDMYESYVLHYQKYWRHNTTLDRIDVDGNYCKENCRRATIEEQANNKKNSTILTIGWVTKNITEWCRDTWFSSTWIRNRYSKLVNWEISINDFFDKDFSLQRRYLIVWWDRYSMYDISKITWLSNSSIRSRYKKYIKWDMTKEDFFSMSCCKWGLKVESINIEWKLYNIQELAINNKVWREAIKKRYNKYVKWEIDVKKLKNLLGIK